MRLPHQSTSEYLSKRIKQKVNNIDELNSLFEDLKSCKLNRIKQYLNTDSIHNYYKQLKVNDEYIKEVFYSYLSDKGAIESSPYLTMFVEQFCLIESSEYHLNYFKAHPICTEKELKLLCLKVCLNAHDKSEEAKKLEELYLNISQNNDSLFSKSFVAQMLDNAFFYEKLDSILIEDKFIEINPYAIKKFVSKNPNYITKQIKNKTIKFLLKIGYDKVLQDNIDMAQELSVQHTLNHFPSQAKIIQDVVPLDSHYLLKLVNKIEEEAKNRSYFSEASIYHPLKINALKLLYEKVYLDEQLNSSTENMKKKLKL